MKKEISVFLVIPLLLITLIPSLANAGNVKKSYINLSKEGNQATQLDIPLNYENADINSTSLVYSQKVAGQHGIIKNSAQRSEEDGYYFETAKKSYILAGKASDFGLLGTSTTFPERTIEMWAKVQTAGDNVLFGKQNNDRIYVGSHLGKWNIGVDISSWDETPISGTFYSVELNKWTHCGLTLKNGIATLYINGNPSIIKTYSDINQNDEFLIGAFSDGGIAKPWGNMQGNIKNIRIWNKAFDTNGMKEKMNYQLKGDEPDLVAAW